MTASPREIQLAGELAGVLVDFLPGKPHPYGDPALSFPAAAQAAGVGGLWPGGSKTPALTRLLADTLVRERPRFCRLVVEIINRGTTRRAGRDPITREEIDRVNEIVARIGFRIPELHDPVYLAALPRAPQAAHAGPTSSSPSGPTDAERAGLATELLALTALAPSPRGLAFERFLNTLFRAFGLDPREPFSLRGEQIDGSFDLDRDVYLLEAKWTNSRIGQAELLTFAGKVTGKSLWTRGLFVSYSGFTEEGLDAFARGRPTSIVCCDALDLHQVLSGALDLGEVLRRKVRRAGETNRTFVPVRELFAGVS